jgi:hypothetical protein
MLNSAVDLSDSDSLSCIAAAAIAKIERESMARGLIILTIGWMKVNDNFKGQVRRTSKKCGGGG